jgi:hypothetical protein
MAPILQGTGTFRAVRTKGVVRVVWVTGAFAPLACAGADAKSPAQWGPADAIWGPFGARSGREFMLTSGLARVDERRISPARHAAALSLFAAYPLWLALGRALARRR